MDNIEQNFKIKLEDLYDERRITLEQLDHFLKRGIQVISPKNDYSLESLSSILPNIVIGASKSYISKLKIPYQTTSFIAAEVYPASGRYIYKIPGRHGGGVVELTGGKRNLGDNIFASTHRILLGYQSILSSVYNIMQNKNQIWNWNFFGNKLKSTYSDIYDDICKLYKIYKQERNKNYFIIAARNKNSFLKSGLVDGYIKQQIAIFNQEIRNVIILTNQDGYDYSSKYIPESDTVKYINTGQNFDMFKALLFFFFFYKIDTILNDGGRIMSNGFKNAGFLAEERITLEPFPGTVLLDMNDNDLLQECTLGLKGSGIDGEELSDSILLHSIQIGQEKANVYVYPLDDSKLLSI